MRAAALVLLMAVAAACESGDAQRTDDPMSAPPIDARVSSADSALSWTYRRELAADLDGDEAAERIVLASDVTADAAGRPLWEDGHRWALFVESPAGERTLLYSGFVPNGFTEAALLSADSGGRRQVLVQERTPGQLKSFSLAYDGPGVVRLSSAAYYQVESWIPGSAALP